MIKKFVTFEIASKLKELGYNEPCFAFFDSENDNKFTLVGQPNDEIRSTDDYKEQFLLLDIICPLWQDVIDWLLKKLDFYYPYLELEIFSDHSGSWYQPRDEGNDELYIEFDNINECVLKAIEVIENIVALKTSKEWLSLVPPEFKLVILDPDGWDRKNYDYSFNVEKITKNEFKNRVSYSTVSCMPSMFVSNW